MKNYYQVLGLTEPSSVEEIRQAYKLYAKKFHPDKHAEDPFFEEKFKEIREAYEQLIKEKEEEENNFTFKDTGVKKEENRAPFHTDSVDNVSDHRNNIKIKIHPFIKIVLYFLSFMIPFAAAGMMADASGGTAAVITFIITFGGLIYFTVKWLGD